MVLCAQVPAAQQPTFKGRSDVVRVFVTVTDRDGRLVTTLAQSDFEIRDEGNRSRSSSSTTHHSRSA